MMNKAAAADPTTYIPVMLREAEALVRRYDVSDDAKVSLLHQSENTMLLIDDARQRRKLVLRVHSQRLAYHSKDSIESELQWMTALRRESDVEVPEVVSAADGSVVQTIAARELDQPRHAVMFSFLEGTEPPEDVLVEKFVVLGEITARMHLHASRWQPPTGFTRHHWNCSSILGADPLWGRWEDGMGVDGAVLTVLGRLSETVERRLASLGQRHEIYGLIHADMRLANLLIEGERTKVIDFDDCGFSWTMYDLATALSFLEDRPFVPELIDSWLQGYRSVAPLPHDIKVEIPTIIMLRRMAEIAWLGTRRHLEFAQSLGADFTLDSCRLAEDYLERLG
jgi:Ser/Thr protein kinase RdoA (MazF antagonist)